MSDVNEILGPCDTNGGTQGSQQDTLSSDRLEGGLWAQGSEGKGES